jgi:putative tryptophan/tyrosine transport system substrate-binding protein
MLEAVMADLARRQFITLLGTAAVAWPLAARAQQPAKPVVGFLHYASPDTLAHLAWAVREGLQDAGYVDGQNVAIEYRWAHGSYDQLSALAADLVRRQVTVIVAGGNVAALAVKKATTTVPIVFTSGADPVESGLVASLSRPEGNLTGVSLLAVEMATKRLELIRDLLPNARTVAMIVNPDYSGAESEMTDVEMAGRAIGIKAHKLTARNARDIDVAFEAISGLHVDAFLVGTDGFFITRRHQLAALAARHVIPAVYPFPDFPAAGGLLSYGVSLMHSYRQAGVYAGRILKGSKPADLPITQPAKFEFVVNVWTARALGLALPPSFHLRADTVID